MDEPPRPPYLPLMTTVEPESEILPPPVQPPPRHRVWRSGDRIVAGVAGGLADVLGVAPLWTRLSFVVLACLEGVGVAAYLAGWLLLPSGPTAKTPSVARRVVGLLVLPMWLLAVSGGDWWGMLTGPAGLVLVLIGVAMALWSPRAASPVEGSAPPPTPVRVDEVASPVPPRQPPSPLGRVTFGIALVVAAAGTVIAQGSSTGIKVAFGLAVVVCAVGLLVGTLLGRARWLVVPAALFAAVSVAGAATENLGVSITGTRQDTTWGPGDEGPPPSSIDKAGGDTDLQLADITEPVDGVIRVGYGEVHITAAEDVRLEVRAQVGLGSIDMPSGSEDGYRRVATYAGGPSNAPLVRYDIAVGFGSIEISRYDPSRRPPDEPKVLVPVRPGVLGLDGQGGVLFRSGAWQLPDGTIVLPDGTEIRPSGVRIFNSPTQVLPSGEVVVADGTRIMPSGRVILPDGVVVEPVAPNLPEVPATAPPVPTTEVQP